MLIFATFPTLNMKFPGSYVSQDHLVASIGVSVVYFRHYSIQLLIRNGGVQVTFPKNKACFNYSKALHTQVLRYTIIL